MATMVQALAVALGAVLEHELLLVLVADSFLKGASAQSPLDEEPVEVEVLARLPWEVQEGMQAFVKVGRVVWLLLASLPA